MIAGTTSHPALRAIAITLAVALPGSRLVELDGSGHVTYFERPEEFAAAVRDFVRPLGIRSDRPMGHVAVPATT